MRAHSHAADRSGNILRRARTATSTSLEEDLANINSMIAEAAGNDKILGIDAAIGKPLNWEQRIVSPLQQPEAERGLSLVPFLAR